MTLVGGLVGVDFEDEDAAGVGFVLHRVEGQHTRLGGGTRLAHLAGIDDSCP